MADINSILELLLPQTKRYENLRPDREKMKSALIQIISTAKHFCWVEVFNKKIKGIIVGLVDSNLWAQRQSCSIVVWISEVPGQGIKLLRELKKWVTSRRAIKQVGFMPDLNDIDPRAWKIAQRLGFNKRGGAYIFYN